FFGSAALVMVVPVGVTAAATAGNPNTAVATATAPMSSETANRLGFGWPLDVCIKVLSGISTHGPDRGRRAPANRRMPAPPVALPHQHSGEALKCVNAKGERSMGSFAYAHDDGSTTR